jgi:hypothetical protein
MYYNHSLRTNLQEWKNRLCRANYEQFAHQIKYLLSNVANNKILSGILNEACVIYRYDNTRMNEIEKIKENGGNLSFQNEADHAAYCIEFIQHLSKQCDYKLHQLMMFHDRDFESIKSNIVEDLVTPMFYFLHDKLDKSSSVIYLLEKYKKRVEWFTKEELLKKYQNASKSYEQIFEDDLRLFLFDQGLDFPFSTPKSASGRADVVGAIDSDDPIVLEIKILDKQKGYGKNRIKEGFAQIVKYANDYNKDVGYLVIFNVNPIEINFKLFSDSRIFPPVLSFNNKSFFFVVINICEQLAASKLGIVESFDITEVELVGHVY